MSSREGKSTNRITRHHVLCAKTPPTLFVHRTIRKKLPLPQNTSRFTCGKSQNASLIPSENHRSPTDHQPIPETSPCQEHIIAILGSCSIACGKSRITECLACLTENHQPHASRKNPDAQKSQDVCSRLPSRTPGKANSQSTKTQPTKTKAP